jgi:hypothetical protein
VQVIRLSKPLGIDTRKESEEGEEEEDDDEGGGASGDEGGAVAGVQRAGRMSLFHRIG